MSRVARIAIFVVATLVLWYAGNWVLRIAWEIFDLPATTAYDRTLNLLLLPLAAVVAWAILRRVPDR